MYQFKYTWIKTFKIHNILALESKKLVTDKPTSQAYLESRDSLQVNQLVKKNHNSLVELRPTNVIRMNY